jgi:hypothetical protein
MQALTVLAGRGLYRALDFVRVNTSGPTRFHLLVATAVEAPAPSVRAADAFMTALQVRAAFDALRGATSSNAARPNGEQIEAITYALPPHLTAALVVRPDSGAVSDADRSICRTE